MPQAMVVWTDDKQGQQAILEDLGYGLDGFAQESARVIASLAPVGTGFHTRHGRVRLGHYKDTIHASTYVNGSRISGQDITAAGFTPAKATLHSIVYTDSSLGHMLEITGAGPHEIPIGQSSSVVGKFYNVVHHPGFTRRPHFAPGILAAAARAAEFFKVRGRVRII